MPTEVSRLSPGIHDVLNVVREWQGRAGVGVPPPKYVRID